MPTFTPSEAARLAGRLLLLLPAGAVLIAAGLGAGETLAAPTLVAALGPPEVWECIDSPDVVRRRFAETTLGTGAIAMLAGVLARWRRYDGWLLINVPSMILGYVLYARATAGPDRTPILFYWGAQLFLIQFVLVWTLYPWLFERSAAWRRGPGPVAIEPST